MEAGSPPAPTDDLVSFVEEVVEWTRPIASAYLDDEQVVLLDRARSEIKDVQLPVIQKDILSIDEEKLKAAGFSDAQAAFKLATARKAMADTAHRAESPLPERRKKALERLDVVVENVQTVLGSLSSLSDWIEAASELVGVVGSGVKAAVAERGFIRRNVRKARRWTKTRRDHDRDDKPEETPPAPATASG